jgi:hypothetical protein
LSPVRFSALILVPAQPTIKIVEMVKRQVTNTSSNLFFRVLFMELSPFG